MSYSLLPPTVSYPAVQTTAWVVFSRLSELPTRTVSDLTLVNHASEFALPFPTGRFPTKTITQTENYQSYDSLGRPLYDDGSPDGVTTPVDGSGNAYPPKLASVTEQVVIGLQDQPTQFTTTEVIAAVIKDFMANYNNFYDWGKLITFDDRFDTISVYENQQVASGFGSGGAPIFMGPIQSFFSSVTNPAGHILLVAPVLQGIDWIFQIRHGVGGSSGFHGPIASIAQASRQTNSGASQEVTKLYPMENTPIPLIALNDNTNQPVNHFWLRTYETGGGLVPQVASIIPFILILGRSTGIQP